MTRQQITAAMLNAASREDLEHAAEVVHRIRKVLNPRPSALYVVDATHRPGQAGDFALAAVGAAVIAMAKRAQELNAEEVQRIDAADAAARGERQSGA